MKGKPKMRIAKSQLHASLLRWTIAAACMPLAAACGDDATRPDGDGALGEYVWSLGLKRTYELRLPSDYNGSRDSPLLLAFHGNPDSGAGFEARSGLTVAADAAGFITVYPDGIDGTWDFNDILLAHNLIVHLDANLSVDLDRVYITGFSAGGTMTSILVCALADELAAAAVVGATLESDIAAACQPPRPIPIVIVHGTDDSVFPWEGLGSGTLRRLSMKETLEVWLTLNRCLRTAVVDTLPDRVDDGTRVWTEAWTDCEGTAEVMLYGIAGGGHTWPGGPGPFPPGSISDEISSTEILDFLARHALDR